jgi:hypothetical protein
VFCSKDCWLFPVSARVPLAHALVIRTREARGSCKAEWLSRASGDTGCCLVPQPGWLVPIRLLHQPPPCPGGKGSSLAAVLCPVTAFLLVAKTYPTSLCRWPWLVSWFAVGLSNWWHCGWWEVSGRPAVPSPGWDPVTAPCQGHCLSPFR